MIKWICQKGAAPAVFILLYLFVFSTVGVCSFVSFVVYKVYEICT
jgi:hypothetical protein